MRTKPLMPNKFKELLKSPPYTLALPETHDPRILHAISYFIESGITDSMINFVESEHFETAIASHPKRSILESIPVIQAVELLDQSAFKSFLIQKAEAKKKFISQKELDQKIQDPIWQAGFLLAQDKVDGAIAGALASTANVIRAALNTVGLHPNGRTVSGSFLLEREEQTFFFADCGVCITPTPAQLADIAYDTFLSHQMIFPDTTAQIAFLSFSTNGSAQHPSAAAMRESHSIFKSRHPEIISDGELQFDAAYLSKIRSQKSPHSPIENSANIFIFPDLNSGNIAYKITQRLAGFHAYGPILQGLNRGYCDLSRGSTVEDIISSCCISLLRNTYLRKN